MNIWNQPYPANINELIEKSNQFKEILFEKLNDSACKTLYQLYPPNHKGTVKKDLALFAHLGYTPNSFFNSKSKSEDEIRGIYVFGEFDEITGTVIPKYVGISRTIFRRLKQHGWGKKHNEATLASMKAIYKKTHTAKFRSEMTTEIILEQQTIIRNYKVVILPEENDYDMYFMEVFLAGVWKTKWNSFKTH